MGNEETIENIEKTIIADPNNPEKWDELALAYESAGNLETAKFAESMVQQIDAGFFKFENEEEVKISLDVFKRGNVMDPEVGTKNADIYLDFSNKMLGENPEKAMYYFNSGTSICINIKEEGSGSIPTELIDKIKVLKPKIENILSKVENPDAFNDMIEWANDVSLLE